MFSADIDWVSCYDKENRSYTMDRLSDVDYHSSGRQLSSASVYVTKICYAARHVHEIYMYCVNAAYLFSCTCAYRSHRSTDYHALCLR
jgi:hypothetical protein